MKKIIFAVLVAALVGPVFAQQTVISKEILGSGKPNRYNSYSGAEVAVKWDNDIYHAPQYMPGFPTAATIWPRIIDVNCSQDVEIFCEGYHYLPSMGRGEYLMIHPMIKEQPIQQPPVVIIREIPVEVIREVPQKKKRE